MVTIVTTTAAMGAVAATIVARPQKPGKRKGRFISVTLQSVPNICYSRKGEFTRSTYLIICVTVSRFQTYPLLNRKRVGYKK
jgi:hypothetical protein